MNRIHLYENMCETNPTIFICSHLFSSVLICSHSFSFVLICSYLHSFVLICSHLSSLILIHLYCFLISLNTLVFLSHNDSYIYIFLLDTLIHLSCLLICFYQRSYSEIINNSYYLIFFRCDHFHSASIHFIHICSLPCPSRWK